MAEKLSREEVLKIAKLARLRLEEDEIEGLRTDLNNILNYIDKLNELDTAGIEPTSHALDVVNVFRDDVQKPGLDEDDVFKNAPQSEHSHFKVPRVID
ncbi:MAG: aspartyl-tRNA(Asn)/glutamyl-tRNA(Gln) amidotransferase subunit [Deferribacteres bacterium]|nr:Aspartyl/glutamyl-tRNA(Asn/Gln) amidotransferase subunit [Deferribacteraceae bacterium]MDK2791497.1 aspartyl-tRNA(Asn)/glutamyl-tRNA(Gln) amidotransferase subunit [Deferribacteres bacterium]